MKDDLTHVLEQSKAAVGATDSWSLGEIKKRDFQRFAMVIGDTNPLYFDPVAARAAGYSDVIAPPLFLSSQMGSELGPPEIELRGDGLSPRDVFPVSFGNLQVLGAGQQVELHAPVHEGLTVKVSRVLQAADFHAGRSGQFLLLTIDRRYFGPAESLLVTCRESFVVRPK